MNGCVGCSMVLLAFFLLGTCIGRHLPSGLCWGSVALPVVLYFLIANAVTQGRKKWDQRKAKRDEEDRNKRAHDILVRCHAVPQLCWNYREYDNPGGSDNLREIKASSPSGGSYTINYQWTDSSINPHQGGWSYFVSIDDCGFKFTDRYFSWWDHERGGDGGDPVTKIVVNDMLSRY